MDEQEYTLMELLQRREHAYRLGRQLRQDALQARRTTQHTPQVRWLSQQAAECEAAGDDFLARARGRFGEAAVFTALLFAHSAECGSSRPN